MPQYPTWAQMRKFRIETYGKGILGWWKQGWVEYPEIMFCGLHAAFGLGLIGYKANDYYHNGIDLKEYKSEYTVYRADDPRVAAYVKYYVPNYTQK